MALVMATGLAAAALAVLLEPYLPARHSLLFPEKTLLLQALGSRPFDIVFIGSSRVYRHVDPRAVETALRQADVPARCLNLGVPGLTVAEQFAAVGEQLAAQPWRPRFVLIEPILNPSIEPGNLDSERVIRFHGPADTEFLLRYIAGMRLKASRKAWYGALHLTAFGYYWANYGKVSGLLSPAAAQAYLDPALSGFMPLGEGIDPGLAPRETSPISDEFLNARLQEWRGRSRPQPLTPAELQVVWRLIGEVRKLGAVPILLQTPRLDWDRRGGETVLDLDSGLSLRHTADLRGFLQLDYSDPADYPAFYRADLWYDATHLGTSGAELFSRQLGTDLAAILRPR